MLPNRKRHILFYNIFPPATVQTFSCIFPVSDDFFFRILQGHAGYPQFRDFNRRLLQNFTRIGYSQFRDFNYVRKVNKHDPNWIYSVENKSTQFGFISFTSLGYSIESGSIFSVPYTWICWLNKDKIVWKSIGFFPHTIWKISYKNGTSIHMLLTFS